jgi:hypothetical protein
LVSGKGSNKHSVSTFALRHPATFIHSTQHPVSQSSNELQFHTTLSLAHSSSISTVAINFLSLSFPVCQLPVSSSLVARGLGNGRELTYHFT